MEEEEGRKEGWREDDKWEERGKRSGRSAGGG